MSRTLSLPENTQGRDFVIGDLHGAMEMLKRAMKEAKFDPAKDRLISVGDLINRGPDSADALWLLQQPWFFAVQGNHETLFIRLTEKDGSLSTLSEKFNRRSDLAWIYKQTPETRAALREAFKKLPFAIDVKTDRGTVGFIHSEVPKGLDWDTFKKKIEAGDVDTIKSALTGRDRINTGDATGVPGIDRVFKGHTPQNGGARQLGNTFYIDTGGVFRLLGTNWQPDMFFTLTDIRAEADDIKGNPANKQSLEKVVVKAPPKGKPFHLKAA